MSRTRVLHAQQCNDVAGLCRAELYARVGVHLDDASDAFGLARKRVQNIVTLFQGARVDPGERQCTVAVIHDLEREGA